MQRRMYWKMQREVLKRSVIKAFHHKMRFSVTAMSTTYLVDELKIIGQVHRAERVNQSTDYMKQSR